MELPTGRGTWNGIFYPPSRGQAEGRSTSSTFYAEHFNTVEVNSTFYGQPRADVAERGQSGRRRGFEFSVKLYQKFTHPKMYQAAVHQNGRQAPAVGRRRPPRRARQNPTQSRSRRFQAQASSRWRRSGKLGALLAQFPPSFKNQPASARLPAVAAATHSRITGRGRTAARSWSDALGPTLSIC